MKRGRGVVRIKRKLGNGRLLVCYRRKGREVTMSIDDSEFDDLYAIVARFRRNGDELPSKSALCGLLAQYNLPQPAAPISSQPAVLSLAQYIGSPRLEQPGQYFRHNSQAKHATQLTYESNCHGLLSSIAHVPMDQLTREDIEAMVFDEWSVCVNCHRSCLVGVACSNHVLSHRRKGFYDALAQLRTVLQTAIRYGLISDDPTRLVKLPAAFKDFQPAQQTGSRPALTPTEVMALIHAHPPEYQALAATAYGCLLRIGEVTGLERRDVTPPAKVGEPAILNIQRTVVSSQGKCHVAENQAKTSDSLNTVALPHFLWQILEEHLRVRRVGDPDLCRRCEEDAAGVEQPPSGSRSHDGCGLAPNAPLFVNRDGTRLWPYQWRDGPFRAAVERAGLDLSLGPVTPHLLRASGATHLAEEGMDVSIIAKIGRWKGVPIVLKHYIRSNTQLKARGASVLDGLLAAHFHANYEEPSPEDPRLRQLQTRLGELEQRLADRVGEVERLRRHVKVLESDLSRLGKKELMERRRVEAHLRYCVQGAWSLEQVLQRLHLKRTDENFALVRSVGEEDEVSLPPHDRRKGWRSSRKAA